MGLRENRKITEWTFYCKDFKVFKKYNVYPVENYVIKNIYFFNLIYILIAKG